jgi:hypothetical protein
MYGNWVDMEGKKQKAKKFGPFLDLCVSSLRRGHANLLCIVPILSDVSEETKVDVAFCSIYQLFNAQTDDMGYMAPNITLL